MSGRPHAPGAGPGATFPARDAFRLECADHNVIPVVRERLADWWTPVTAFRRLAPEAGGAFLLESVEGGERIGRWSFLGRNPFLDVASRGGKLRLRGEAGTHSGAALPEEPLQALRKIVASYRAPKRPGLPPFAAGAVGYLGYDVVRELERIPDRGLPPAPEDDFRFLFLGETAAFDHVRGRLSLVANARVPRGTDPDAAYDDALHRLDLMEADLRRGAAPGSPDTGSPAFVRPRTPPAEAVPAMAREAFELAVRRAQDAIAAGDIFQVVLSQRFLVSFTRGPLHLYRALRAVNPSPYMFLLRFPEWSAVGSSPEPLLKVSGDRLSYRPIAGTSPRGADSAEDALRARNLRDDAKERAEHVMLVDLGRNDLGRTAVPGTVRVDEFMTVERYSHVMHLVSGLSARLRPDLSPLEALFACFPAGTVSGAPKVRAMEIIEDLEPHRRGLYGGAVGYLDFSGNLDTCIALRTMVLREGEVRIQAGAGIVADSAPEREYEETLSKAQALFAAVRLAETLEDDEG